MQLAEELGQSHVGIGWALIPYDWCSYKKGTWAQEQRAKAMGRQEQQCPRPGSYEKMDRGQT